MTRNFFVVSFFSSLSIIVALLALGLVLLPIDPVYGLGSRSAQILLGRFYNDLFEFFSVSGLSPAKIGITLALFSIFFGIFGWIRRESASLSFAGVGIASIAVTWIYHYLALALAVLILFGFFLYIIDW